MMTDSDRRFVAHAQDRTNGPASPGEMEVLFRQIAENVREVFWIFSPDFTETIYVSPAYEQLWGRPVEEVYERPGVFVEAVHPADLDGLLSAMQAVSHEQQDGVEFRVVQPDGTVRWALARGYPVRDENGEVDRVVGTTEDITQRKEAEARLSAAEAHYRWLVENAPYAIYALDADGCFIELNPAGVAFVGRPVDEVLGQHFSTVIAPVDLEKATRAFEDVMAGEADALVFEERLRLPSGEERLVEVTESAIWEDGAIVGTHGIARDITGEAERERQLRRAERLASLGTLVGGVAHELNNPLHSIVSFVTLLLEDERPEEERNDLKTIQREAARAASIVSDLRLIASSTEDGPDERGPVDLNDVVRHVLRTRRYSLETRSIEVREELAADAPLVFGERGPLEQVVLNLVVNAEHALEGHEARRLLIRTVRTDDGISLQVTDTGPGIPEEHRDHVFDPFFTTKPPGVGTGLGLSLVHRIIRDHGGSVYLESEVGSSTTFRIDLPAGSRKSAPAGSPAGGDPERPLRVLVVDDEPAIRKTLSRYLVRRRGHEVDEAEDGAEALEILESGTAEYDVIVSDLRMPGLGGDQLMERLAALGTGLDRRMIFLTGDAASGQSARLLATANVPVIYKPVDLPVLSDRIERHAAELARSSARA